MAIFYAPNLGTSDKYTLSEEESKHAVKVLRMSENSTLELIDGLGTFCKASVLVAHPKKCEVHIQQRIKQKPSRKFELLMAVAPTKNMSRFEWFIEKATELGVDGFIPLRCEHSERKTINVDRLKRLILSAAKQSKQAYLPTLSDIQTFEGIVEKYHQAAHCFLAHCSDDVNKSHLINQSVYKPQVVIFIGPEGDFSEIEIKLAKKLGVEAISLGEARLRTETAAIAACHIANIWNYV